MAVADQSLVAAGAVEANGYGRRLLALLLVGNVFLFAVYWGFLGTLLPALVQDADPANKVATFGLISGIGAIVATVMNPLGGALSDRTRSRFGRRTPWLVGASVATLAAALLTGAQTTVAGLLIGWCLVQAVANTYQAAITAVVPDRVPPERRGVASAVVGLGPLVGVLTGLAIVGQLLDTPVLAAGVLGGLLVGAAVAFVVLAPDRPATSPAVASGRSLAAAIGSFFSSLRYPDFRWVFVGRLLLVLGYFAVQGYYFYLLQDYVGVEAVGVKPEDGVLILSGLSTLGSVPTILLGGWLSDRFERRKPFVIGASLVMTVNLLIPIVSPTWEAMLAFSLINGLAFGAYIAVDTALVTLVLPAAKDAARDMGILNIANAGPQIVAPLVAAVIITALGGYQALFVFAALFALLGALAIVPVRSVR